MKRQAFHPDDVCPNEWKVRGWIRGNHSMFHPSLHECGRERGHTGRCRCRFCNRTTTKGVV